MTPGLLPDIFSEIPDLPRWVDGRGLVLSPRGFLLNAADGCRVVGSRADRLIVPVTIDLTRDLHVVAGRGISGPATILLQEVRLGRGGCCRTGRPHPRRSTRWSRRQDGSVSKPWTSSNC